MYYKIVREEAYLTGKMLFKYERLMSNSLSKFNANKDKGNDNISVISNHKNNKSRFRK